MIKKLLFINLFLIIIVFLLSTFKISYNNTKEVKIINLSHDIINKTISTAANNFEKINQTKEEDIYFKLIINKLKINSPVYSLNSKNNNVEKNITILKGSTKPDDENSLIILAAHSGSGHIAYFKDLNKLELNDEIIINYNNINYHYIIKDIFESKKNGYINIGKIYQKQLVLTTCSPNKKDYQLTIISSLK